MSLRCGFFYRDGTIHLKSIDLMIDVIKIYERVNFKKK